MKPRAIAKTFSKQVHTRDRRGARGSSTRLMQPLLSPSHIREKSARALGRERESERGASACGTEYEERRTSSRTAAYARTTGTRGGSGAAPTPLGVNESVRETAHCVLHITRCVLYTLLPLRLLRIFRACFLQLNFLDDAYTIYIRIYIDI